MRTARHGLPLMLAIIGGSPQRFGPYIDLYRRAADQFGKHPHPVGLHSPGFVADTDEEAKELGCHDLEEGARPSGAPDRKAIAIAGDDPDDLTVAVAVVEGLGFDPVVAGPLAEGLRIQPGTELFGANTGAAH
ncbi:hypothetical protein [Streptomyces sp. NPDC018833]|uniref:hypothetical protein n=1 Tax=Streptomyces sp. NPDC018833 TaxID=3365053 RepID=UPI00378A50B8